MSRKLGIPGTKMKGGVGRWAGMEVVKSVGTVTVELRALWLLVEEEEVLAVGSIAVRVVAGEAGMTNVEGGVVAIVRDCDD